jgi:hypothetical protein
MLDLPQNYQDADGALMTPSTGRRLLDSQAMTFVARRAISPSIYCIIVALWHHQNLNNPLFDFNA